MISIWKKKLTRHRPT